MRSRAVWASASSVPAAGPSPTACWTWQPSPKGPAVVARAISRPAYLRGMARLMPRESRAIPSSSYVLLSPRKPGAPGTETT